MSALLLRITVVEKGVTKSLRFDKSMSVFDACKYVNTKINIQNAEQVERTHGLFLPNDDPTDGAWLESGKTLNSYHFKVGTTLEYRSKLRPLRVRTLDEAVRRVFVDDSHCVQDITRAVCARIGIQNPQEFSFTVDDDDAVNLTLKKGDKPGPDRKLETLRREKHTHDFLSWVDPKLTLRQQGLVSESVTLTLRKKYFFSDKNVDANDPVQLHFLYTQSCEAVTNGEHPVTEFEAVQLAALRCQEMYGDYTDGKFQKGFFRSALRGLLPVEYRKESRKLEDSVVSEYLKLTGQNEQKIKFCYIEMCRKLNTYGISFFAVKEKVHRRNKLHPVLLGVKRESVIKLDVKSKEVLETWALPTVQSYCSTPTSFCLNFGGYRGVYIVKTTEGEAIVQLLDGYINLIQQTLKKPGRDTPSSVGQGHSELTPTDPKERLRVVISSTIDCISKSLESMEMSFDLNHTKFTNSKRTTVHITSLKLCSSLSALLYSSGTMMSEVLKQKEDSTCIAAASFCIGASISSVADCSRLLAALGLTDKDKARILSAVRSLSATCVRLLEMLQEGQNVQAHIILVLEDVASRSSDVMAIIGFKRVKDTTYNVTAPLLLEVVQSVSSLLAQARRMIDSCDVPDFEAELIACIKDVEVSSRVVESMFFIVSSFINSPISQEKLCHAIKHVADCVQTLCTSSKSMCLDDGLLIEVAGSASAVTSSLDCLLKVVGTQHLAGRRHPLEQMFQNVLVESKILIGQLKKHTPKKLLVHTKLFVEAIKTLMEEVKSYNDTQQIDLKKDVNVSLKQLSSINLSLVDSARDIYSKHQTKERKIYDAQVEKVESAVSSARRFAGPYLDHIQECQFVATVRSTADSSYNLVLMLKVAVELVVSGSLGNLPMSREQLLTRCDDVLENHLNILYSVLFDGSFPEERCGHNYHKLLAITRDCIPQIKTLLVITNSLRSKLESSPTHRHVSLELTKWSLWVNRRVYELEMLIAKTKYHVPSRMVKSSIESLKQELQPALDRCTSTANKDKSLEYVSEDIYFEKCAKLVASCRRFHSFTSQLLGIFDPVYTYHRMTSEVQKIVYSVLELGGLRNCEGIEMMMPLALKLLNQTEVLANLLMEFVQGHPEVTKQIQEKSSLLLAIVSNIRDVLPLQSALGCAVEIVKHLELDLDNTESTNDVAMSPAAVEEKLNSACGSITTFLFNIIKKSNWQSSAPDFVTNFKVLVSAAKSKASVCMDVTAQSAILTKLRFVCNSTARMLQTAKDVCYDPCASQMQLAPAAQHVITVINKLLSSVQPRVEEHEAEIMQLQASLLMLDVMIEPSPVISHIECTVKIAEQSEIIVKVTESPKDNVEKCNTEAVRDVAASISRAVAVIANSGLQAASLSAVPTTTEELGFRSGSYSNIISSSQLRVWCNQFLNECDQLLDETLAKHQLSATMARLSRESNLMCNTLKFVATSFVAQKQRKLVFQNLETMAKSVVAFLDDVKVLHEVRTEENMSTCKSRARQLSFEMDHLCDVCFVVDDFTYATPKEKNERILEVTKETLLSALKWLTTRKDYAAEATLPEINLKLTDEACSLRRHTESLLAITKEQLSGHRQYQLSLDKLRNLQDELGTVIFNSGITKAANGESLRTQLKKIVSVCSQMESQVALLSSFPNLDFIGNQVCTIAQAFPALGKAVLSAASLSSISEHEQSLIQSTITCLEVVIDILSKFNTIGTGLISESALDTIEFKVRQLQIGISELMSTTNTVNNGAIDSGILEISKTMDKLEMPLIVVEEVDSSVTVHTLLLGQYETLAKLLRSTALEQFPELYHQIIHSYKEIVRISHMVFGDSQMDAIVQCTIQSLGEFLINILVSSGHLQQYPESETFRMQLMDSIMSTLNELSRLKLLSQVSDDDDHLSAIVGLRELHEVLDSTLVVTSLRQLETDLAIEEADFSGWKKTRKLSIQSVATVYEALSSLLQLSPITPESLSAPIRVAMDALVPMVTFLNETNSISSPINLMQILATTTVLDIATSLMDVILITTSNSPDSHQIKIVKTAEFAQSAARLLLKAAETQDFSNSDTTEQDYMNVLDGTINYLRYMQELGTPDLLLVNTEMNTYDDLVHSTTSLSFALENLKQACQSLCAKTVGECTVMARIAVTEVVSIFSAVARRSEDELAKQEIPRSIQRSISAFITTMTELRTVSTHSTDADLVNRRFEDISLAIGELIMFANDFKGQDVSTVFLDSSKTLEQRLSQLLLNSPINTSQHLSIEEEEESPDGKASLHEKAMSLETVTIEARAKICRTLSVIQSTLDINDKLSHDNIMWLQSAM